MRNAFGTAVIAVLLTAVGCDDNTGGSGGQPSGDSVNVPSTPSVEYKLAVIDAQEPLDSDDPAINNYVIALDQLEMKCKNSRELLADYAVKVTERLDRRGIELSALAVIQRVDQSIPKAAPRMRCADVFADFVTLRGRS